MSLWLAGMVAFAARSEEGIDFCGGADAVVIVEITSQESRWTDAPQGGIETLSWFATEQLVRGTLEDHAIVSQGGRVGPASLWVEDEASLQVDGRYLLFLKKIEAGYRVLGGEQGVLPLAHSGGAPRVCP